MAQSFKVHNDMIVRDNDGHKIGKIVNSNDIGFQIETGMFFHKEYFTTYSHIVNVSGNEVRLDCGLQQLDETEEFGTHAGDPLGTSFIQERDWRRNDADHQVQGGSRDKRAV